MRSHPAPGMPHASLCSSSRDSDEGRVSPVSVFCVITKTVAAEATAESGCRALAARISQP